MTPKKISPPTLPGRWDTLLAEHNAHQSVPAFSERVSRPEKRGRLIVAFVLPIALCRPQNANRHRDGWAMSKDRAELLNKWLRPQLMAWRSMVTLPRLPLPQSLLPTPNQLPQVLCYRYSSIEPDSLANWGKQAVDCLVTPYVRWVIRKVNGRVVKTPKAVDGLGLIEDDCPSMCEVVETWEPAPRGKGYVIIEVWSGVEAA